MTRSAQKQRRRWRIYGGRDPGKVPAYPVSEAARYVKQPQRTVHNWVVGTKTSNPVILIADPDRRLLSFEDLLELHALSSIRREYEVRLPAIRSAMAYLRREFRSRHPLLEHELVTDRKSLLKEVAGKLVNLSHEGQMQMGELMKAYLERIERDSSGIPIRLFPYTRREQNPAAVHKAPRIVAINPLVQFGRPCIAGTRLRTDIIAERHHAGETVTELAEDYDRSPAEISEAILFEAEKEAA